MKSIADKKQETINTYNQSANLLAARYNNYDPRTTEIEMLVRIVGRENPSVLEIGSGTGKDAHEISKYTNRYIGIDISEELVKIAQADYPDLTFMVADVDEFVFPANLDIIFGSGSLVHTPKEDMQRIIDKAYLALNPGGVLHINVKHADTYSEVTKTDEFGTRHYYHYPMSELLDMSRQFTPVFQQEANIRGQIWIDLTLQK